VVARCPAPMDSDQAEVIISASTPPRAALND
jgi:hypothetical protein